MGTRVGNQAACRRTRLCLLDVTRHPCQLRKQDRTGRRERQARARRLDAEHRNAAAGVLLEPLAHVIPQAGVGGAVDADVPLLRVVVKGRSSGLRGCTA